ncbi:hypothetical protein HY486_03355 [Candidatus Woesearchaeota archaeon]|nr:hypothetical protein [Candidatus Woesearchaeota archaeon]
MEWYLSPIIFFPIVIIASLYVIFKSADLLVYGVSRYSKKLGMSESTSGLLVVALAASMPEIVSSFMGININDIGVGLGAILGTNMVHLVLLLGVVMVVGKNIQLQSEVIKKIQWLLLIVLLLPLILLLDKKLSRIDGIILLLAFAFYLKRVWNEEGKLGKLHNVPAKKLLKDGAVFLGALAAMLLAGRMLAYSTSILAGIFDIPSYLLAITIIGVGAAIPDFAVNLRAVMKSHTGVGVGESLGSVAIELCLYFGLIGIFFPFSFESNAALITILFLIAGLLTLMYLIHKGKANWKHGIALIGMYAIFIIVQIMMM